MSILARLFGSKHRVKEGDRVEWVVHPHHDHWAKPFKVKGVVVEVGVSTFAGKYRRPSARVRVLTAKYKNLYGKQITNVQQSTLTVIK